MNNHFMTEFDRKLSLYRKNEWRDNWDWRRFGHYQSPNLLSQAKSTAKMVLGNFRLYQGGTLKAIQQHKEDFQWLYERLVDEESRATLLDVLAYRVLGHRKVKLSLNTVAYWEKLEKLEHQANASDPIDLGFLGWQLNLHDLADEGYPIRVYARAPGVHTQLLLQQYRCATSGYVIEVAPGDTVIDAGGCYGDTALYFAHKAGPDGKVFSFEFMKDNIRVFNRNLELNHDLAKRIVIVPNPLWSTSGQKLYVEGIGPAAHVTPEKKTEKADLVETLTIDDLVQRENISRVDFIKMDIEGSELEALKGAEGAIRRFHPKLAISVYHRFQDFWEIAQWIEHLGLGYRFHLRHFTIHAEETVLFAEAL